MTKKYNKYENELEDGEDVDLGLDKPSTPTYRTAVATASNQMNDMPIRDMLQPDNKCCSGVCVCFEKCSDCWCCCLKSGRSRAFGGCLMCMTILIFLIVIIAMLAAQTPHKSKELIYTIGHSSWDEYYNLQNAIQGKGANVCKIDPAPRLYPACDKSTVLFGRSGVPYLRAITEEGTRVSTMDRYCKESLIPLGDFTWDCLDESWFHHSSLAHYDYNVNYPTKVFNAQKHVFLIRDPFEAAIDLYYRRFWSRRLNPFKTDPMKTFSDHQSVMTFTIKEFKEWSDFMELFTNFTRAHPAEHFEIIWYDELNSDQLWRNTTEKLFTFIRDEEYFPTVEQSLKCIDESNLEDGPSYVKGLPARELVFSAADRKTLCPMVIKYWEHQRWGDFCMP